MLLGAASPAVALVYVPTEVPAPGDGSSDARAINDSAQVAGTADVGGGVEHAVRFDAGTGVLADLGTLGGSDSSGWGVNAAGEVTGTARIWGSTVPCAPFDGAPGPACSTPVQSPTTCSGGTSMPPARWWARSRVPSIGPCSGLVSFWWFGLAGLLHHPSPVTEMLLEDR